MAPKRKITLGHLNISAAGKQYVNDALDNNRLSYGPYTKRFEDVFAAQHRCKYGVFCNSGTSALQIALATLKEVHKYRNGEEVIVPATTFIATSNVVIQNGMRPVFVDVDPKTFNLDPSKLEEAITPRTRAIMPVHLFGLPANMPAISDIARRHNLQVIEDSCETMFASVEGRPVGSWGDMACFSTYVAHLIVGGVGGLVTTNDKKYEDLCRSYMQHGRNTAYTNIDQDDTEEAAVLRDMISRRYKFERVGYSYRATELEAAVALSEFERWPSNITIRRRNAEYLTARLRDLESLIQTPFIPAGYEHSFMMYPMVLSSLVDREDFLLHLEKNGIETRYLFPLLSQPIYRKLFHGEASRFPVASNLAEHGFFIGMHQGLTPIDMDYVSDVIHEYFKGKI
jgi:dTDP-4-amino-4,6-dideoxygalactose transaminase